jgi:hypothetical protein
MYAVSPIPVNSSSVAADRAFIGSAPHHASTAATARTHNMIVCTVPTARATEIETRMAEADRGEVEPATTALESLRRRR